MSQLYPVFNKSSWKELQHNSNKKREADHTEHLFLLAESEDFTSLKKEKNLSSHINDLHNHRTLLHVACRLKNVEMVEYFLSFPNIDVNKGISKEPEEEDYCEEEESPLYLACEKNFLKIAKLLLSHPSIDVGKGSSSMYHHTPPLFVATSREIVKQIISHPTFNPNTSRGNTEFSQTALYWACSKEDEELVKILSSHPNININGEESERKYGKTSPLGEACRTGNAEIVNILLSHPDIDVNLGWDTFSSSCMTPFDLALGTGSLHVAYILMKQPKFDNSSGDAVFAACQARPCRIEPLKLALTQPLNFKKDEFKHYYWLLSYEKNWNVVDLLLLSGVPFTSEEDATFGRELKQSLTNRKEMLERLKAKHHAKYFSLIDNARSFSDLKIVTTIDLHFD